ncbi:MAG: aminodeoxychorismate synthase component I [Gemmatimonadales bacterium]|nr:aminodeoxychorismate synthase component I [Gemmatimonadales bacterium]
MSPGPAVREVVPAPDPEATALRLAAWPRLLWLDGAADPERLGRYSYLAADPSRVVRGAGALHEVRRALSASPITARPDLPPFQGGAAGWLAYDFGHTLERIPATRYDDLALPLAEFGVYDAVLAWDHQQGRCWAVGPDADRVAWLAAVAHGRTGGPADADGSSAGATPPAGPPTYPVLGVDHAEALGLRSTFTRRGYIDAVQRVRDYIVAGDIFQANLSQRFQCALPCAPFPLYRTLRRRNPAPFAAFLAGDGWDILSASPERFLRLDGRTVETRPIKGTAPRGLGPMHDLHLGRALTESAKDRAENVMIVDLLRNDLSRVCAAHSVRVPALFALESHPTVHHLVSTVTGTLADGRDAIDLLEATFPGGSITGAPKVRAMEIIAELEPTARGVYCGAIGWLGFDGAMDTSIAIRTIVARHGQATFSAGGGIVHDSEPEREYDETLSKARGLIAALAAARGD